MTTAARTHPTLPAERLFWATAPGESNASLTGNEAAAAIDALHGSIPLDPESVHTAVAKLGSGMVICCGMRCDELAEFAGTAMTLRPEGPPSFLAQSPGLGPVAWKEASEHLNLLTGPFEPDVLRSARRNTRGLLAITILSIAILLGFERYRAHAAAASEARDAEERLGAIFTEAGFGQVPAAAASTLNRLLADRRRELRNLPQDPPDAARALSAILTDWPESDAAVQALSVHGGAIQLSCTLSDHDAAQRFASELRLPPGYGAPSPRIIARDGKIRLLLSAAKEARP